MNKKRKILSWLATLIGIAACLRFFSAMWDGKAEVAAWCIVTVGLAWWVEHLYQNEESEDEREGVTPEDLKAAAHNFELMKPDLCDCETMGKRLGGTVYYRDPKTGSRGWMCDSCHGIIRVIRAG